MLIPFPIAFFSATILCDIIARLTGSRDAFVLGYYLGIAGVVTAILAALPGLMDYSGSVPPASSAKKYAIWHMLSNLLVIAVFLAAWFLKRPEGLRPEWSTLILEAIGAGLLGFAGFLGGTLAYRFQIGVDHYYAEAGQWREITIENTFGDAVIVATPDELQVGQMKLIRIATPNSGQERRVVLARGQNGYLAFDDHCTHQGGSLADGACIRDYVQCPWHGSQFNMTTGQVNAGPAGQPVSTYEVRQTGSRIELLIRDLGKRAA